MFYLRCHVDTIEEQKMAAKRKNESLYAYIHSVSPQKNNFHVRLQTRLSGANTVKAICFDATKKNELINAKLSGDALKLSDIVKQTNTKDYYAEYIINKNTIIEKAEPVNVPFRRIEPEVSYSNLDEEFEVGKLVSVRAILDASHTVEHTRRVNNMRNTKVVNQAYLYNDRGSIEFTYWSEWITFFNENLHNNNNYFDCINLLVKEYDDKIHLSTCCDTQIFAITDELVPDVAAPINTDETQVTLTEIEIIHSIEYGYSCKACNNVIKVISKDQEILTCTSCDAVSRANRMTKQINVIFQAQELGEKLYRLNLDDMQTLTGPVSFDSDVSELKTLLMSLRNITVNVYEKENKVTPV